jgi:hypothetical protein
MPEYTDEHQEAAWKLVKDLDALLSQSHPDESIAVTSLVVTLGVTIARMVNSERSLFRWIAAVNDGVRATAIAEWDGLKDEGNA